jgi:hypothetical protein
MIIANPNRAEPATSDRKWIRQERKVLMTTTLTVWQADDQQAAEGMGHDKRFPAWLPHISVCDSAAL